MTGEPGRSKGVRRVRTSGGGSSTAGKPTASAASDWYLLFADDKPTLHGWRQEAITFAATLRLTLHEGRAQVVPVDTGLPFLGWRVYPYRRRLKRRNVLAFARRFRRLRAHYVAGRCTLADMSRRLQGWLGHARQGNTLGLRRSLLRKPLSCRGAQHNTIFVQ